MKSSKKNFRGIVVLERNLAGKFEPKYDHDFSIPGRLKQKKRNTVLISSVFVFVRDIVLQNFEMKRNGTYL